MKRRKSSGAYRKEKAIMVASTVLVLAAMTVTGLFIYKSNPLPEAENNVVDFSALEQEQELGPVAQAENDSAQNLTSGQEDAGELDYDPYYVEADRKLNEQEVSAPGEKAEPSSESTEESREEERELGYYENRAGEDAVSGQAEGEEAAVDASEEAEIAQEPDGEEAAGEPALEAVADVGMEADSLHFEQVGKLDWPIVGNVLINYSMDRTVFFPTLSQYKYNPSIVIAATQGTSVACAADGIVESVYEDVQTGTTVVMNLGDGYTLTYGQLTNISVEEGDFVETGVELGKVAAPTKYFTVEGTNVYFKMTKDGEPVNPMDYLS